ncbi:hypothetical protein BGZ92_005042 [Podila epicladia]|nr:hypothetical protein BGZ92_005042 [Podila epicladia]
MTVNVQAQQPSEEERPTSRDISPHASHHPKQGSIDYERRHPEDVSFYSPPQRPKDSNVQVSSRSRSNSISKTLQESTDAVDKNWQERSPISPGSRKSEGPFRNTRHSQQYSSSREEGSLRDIERGARRKSSGDEEYKDELMSEEGQDNGDDELYEDNDDDDENANEDNDDEDEDEEESESTQTSKNEDGTNTLVFSMYGARKQSKVRSMFVDKLLKMVEDPSIQHLISWAKEGDMFYVYNCVKLSQYILPKFFKHNNWQSFVRQLNMYGFHKIYRYDREESSMNRKNPETQRWQFYHPHFQREFPHLRKNIKRKSTRTMSAVPTASRVVFEHGKGYFLQREDRSRSNSGEENGPEQTTKASPTLDENSIPTSVPSVPAPTRHYSHYATLGSVSNIPPVRTEPSRRDRKLPDTIAPPITRENGPVYPHHNPAYLRETYERPRYDTPDYRHSSFSDRPHAFSPRYSVDTRPHERPSGVPLQDPQGTRPPLTASSPIVHDQRQLRPGQLPSGYFSPQDPGRREYGQRPDQRHGSMSQGSVLGSPLGHPDLPSSPLHANSMGPQASPRATMPGHSLHRSLGSIGEASIASNSPTRPPIDSPSVKDAVGPPSPHGSNVPLQHRLQEQHLQQHMRHESLPSHPQPLDDHRQGRPPGPGPFPKEYANSQFTLPPPPTPPLPSGNNLTTTIMPPSSSPLSASNRHVPSPSSHSQPLPPQGRPVIHESSPDQQIIKGLESRLAFVEDAFASMKQFTQRLENIQASQDRTLSWMRDRLEQLTEGSQFRDSLSSPPTPQSLGPISTKRKADYPPEDMRSRPRLETSREPFRPVSHSSPGRREHGPDGGPSDGRPRFETGSHPSFTPGGHPGQYSVSPQDRSGPPPPHAKHPYPMPSHHQPHPVAPYGHSQASGPPSLPAHHGYPAHSAPTSSHPHHIRHQRLNSSS